MKLLAGLPAAACLLSVLPVPQRYASRPMTGAALVWFSPVGLLLGAIFAATGMWASSVMPAQVAAALAVAALAWLTGGLHLDGVADTFDALGGGRRDPERMLSIMRDSRIGAHGSAALLLLLLTKVLATAQLLGLDAPWAMLLAPALARFTVVPALIYLPSARADGLGHSLASEARPSHMWLATIPMLVMLALWPAALAPSLVGGAIAAGLFAWMRARLGGLTGDIHGAAIELSETAFLICAVALSD